MHLFVREATRPLTGEVLVPASKYHAHRALILASLARGETRIVGGCDARHVRSTVEVLRGLGIGVEDSPAGFLVQGGEYHPQREQVSVGSSGTTLYFMVGLASLASAPVTLTGQKYFQRRPIGPLLHALREVGVQLDAEDDRPPIHVAPSRPTGGHVRIAGKLSQWISGLVLLAPFATGPTTIEVEGELNERPYVELTVRMMRQFGLEVEVSEDWRRFEVQGGQEATPTTVVLPPDLGSAAFGLAVTSIHPSDVTFRGLTGVRSGEVDHPEADVLDVMAAMGVPMALDPESGQVRVHHDGTTLRGVDVDCRPMPDMLPVLAALGAFAEGTTRFHNVEHVRLKESDRVVSMLQLNRMGADVRVDGDQLVVRGSSRRLQGAPLSSYNDHRVHMALTVAASRARGESSLTYPRAYRISYPAFLDDMGALGVPLAVEERGRSRTTAGGGSDRPAAAIESVAIDQAAEMTIVEWVDRWVRERPGETAIVDVRAAATRAWSWRALDEAADRAASLLLELGVQPGERVAYQLPNWGEFVVLTLAALRIGAVCCPLMPIFREREVALALERSKARVLVVPERFRGREHLAETRALLDDGGCLGVEHVVVLGAGDEPATVPEDAGPVRFHDWAAATERQRPDADALQARRPAATALAQLLFTSGTSGEPKGVLHRFDALTRAAAMEIEHLGLGREDRIFIPSPLAHQTGFLYGMWLTFVLGTTQVLQDVWEPVRAARALRAWDGSFVQAATPFLDDLVRVVEEGEPRPPALRTFVVTGAAVPRVLAERATRVLDAAVCGAWGSTESCLGALAAPGDEPEQVWGTDGRALAGTRLRVTDEDGNVLPAGVQGNFEVASRCMFEGYLDHPEWTAEAFTADGWYRTGDLATIDEAGFLRITGRVKDVINRGGEKVPVAEIEQLLHAHPSVEDVAVVGMPDDRLGERACAFVVTRAGHEALDLTGVQAYLDEHKVAKQYWPERVEPIDVLPRNPVGKIQKFVLRERTRALVGAAGG